MAVEIDKETLENACKEIIETILFCLPNASKGTVYQISKPPELVSTRVATGTIDDNRTQIIWDIEGDSDYDYPGKPWTAYMDMPNRPLEAMAWCVEEQKSWTAEDPENDARSVRLQVEGVLDDFHHMEPVLIQKADVFNGSHDSVRYPANHKGEIVWQDTDYIVAAVIKIHFYSDAIKMGGHEARTIKKLSRTLGTELLSYQLRRQSLDNMRKLAEDKLHSCNILAHTLRNTIAKSGLIFSLIKLELGSLREQWEEMLLQNTGLGEMKREAIDTLNHILEEMDGASGDFAKSLSGIQNKFLELSLPPDQGKRWVCTQIENKWNDLLLSRAIDADQVAEVHQSIDKLKRSLYLGKDPALLSNYHQMPESLKKEWTDLIYQNIDQPDPQFLDRLSHILLDNSLNLPHQEKNRKSLVRLKALVEIIGELEQNTNLVLREVMNSSNKATSDDLTGNRGAV